MYLLEIKEKKKTLINYALFAIGLFIFINFKIIFYFCILGIVFFGLLIFNLLYFGQILPNPFYMKISTNIILNAKIIFNDFLFLHVGIYIFIIFLDIKYSVLKSNINVLILEIIVFVVPLFLINQSMNYLFSFYYPIVPIIIIFAIYTLYHYFILKKRDFFSDNLNIFFKILEKQKVIASILISVVIGLIIVNYKNTPILKLFLIFISALIVSILLFLRNKSYIIKKHKIISISLIGLSLLASFSDFAFSRNFAFSYGKSIKSCHMTIRQTFGHSPDLYKNKIAVVKDAGAIPYYSNWQVYDYFLSNPKIRSKNNFNISAFYVEDPEVIIMTIYSNIFQKESMHFNNTNLQFNDTIILNRLFKTSLPYERIQILSDERFKSYTFISIFEFSPDYYQYIFFKKDFIIFSQDLISDLQSKSNVFI